MKMKNKPFGIKFTPLNNPSKNEYRIREFCGRYYVEIKVSRVITTGHLWWKESYCREEWRQCTPSGNELICLSFQSMLPPYKSLKEARGSIKLFMKGTIYHSIK